MTEDLSEKYRAVFHVAAAQGLYNFCDVIRPKSASVLPAAVAVHYAINPDAIFGRTNYCKLPLPESGTKELTLASKCRVSVSRPGVTFVLPQDKHTYEVYLFNTVPANGLFVNIPLILNARTHNSNCVVRQADASHAIARVKEALLGGTVPVDLFAMTRDRIGSSIYTQSFYRTIIEVICAEINKAIASAPDMYTRPLGCAAEAAQPVDSQGTRNKETDRVVTTQEKDANAVVVRKRRSREVDAGPPIKRVTWEKKGDDGAVTIIDETTVQKQTTGQIVLFRSTIPHMDRAACARLFRTLRHPLFFPTLTLGKGARVLGCEPNGSAIDDAARHMADVPPYSPYVLFVAVDAEHVAYVEECMEQNDKSVLLRTLNDAIALRHHQAHTGTTIDWDAYVGALEGYWVASNEVARRGERLAAASGPPTISVMFGGVVSTPGNVDNVQPIIVDF